jgi:hypothetical protein
LTSMEDTVVLKTFEFRTPRYLIWMADKKSNNATYIQLRVKHHIYHPFTFISTTPTYFQVKHHD